YWFLTIWAWLAAVLSFPWYRGQLQRFRPPKQRPGEAVPVLPPVASEPRADAVPVLAGGGGTLGPAGGGREGKVTARRPGGAADAGGPAPGRAAAGELGPCPPRCDRTWRRARGPPLATPWACRARRLWARRGRRSASGPAPRWSSRTTAPTSRATTCGTSTG